MPPTAAGGDDAFATTPHAVQLGADSQPGTAQRVLGHVSLSGATHWLVPDGDATTSASRVYPDKSTPRTLSRASSLPLSPGCLVGIHVVAAPSGPCQRSDGEGGFEEDASVGIVRARVTYREPLGTTIEAEAVVAIPPSGEALNAEPSDVFTSLLLLEALAEPEIADDDLAAWSLWLGVDVVADIELELVGSPRPVDIAIVEVARAVVVPNTIADPWPVAMYCDENGTPFEQPATTWPLVSLDASLDKSLGVLALAEAIASHGDRLGPVLWWWSAGEGAEGTGTLADWIADGGAPPLVLDANVWLHVATGEWSESDQMPGALAASHASAVVRSGEEALGLRTGTLPVWIAARFRVAGTGSAELRVSTSDWDAYVLTRSSMSFGWAVAAGHIEVGASPETATTLRAYMRSSVDGLQAELTDIVVLHRQG